MMIWRPERAGAFGRTLGMLLTALAVSALPAQQVGDADRDLVINGRGSLQPSHVATTVPVPGPLGLDYRTSVPGAPVLLVAATTGQIGWLTTPANSIDIGPGGLVILLDGTSASGLGAALASTGADGRFALTWGLPAALAGSASFVAAAHVTAASPAGFFISQTHGLTLATYCPQPPLVESFATTAQRDVVTGLGWTGNGRLEAVAPGTALFGSGASGFVNFGAGFHEIDTSLVATPSGATGVTSVLHVPGGVLEATSLIIANGATVRVFGDYPLDIRCTGFVTIDGTLDGSAFDPAEVSTYGTWTPGIGQFNNGTSAGLPNTVRGGRGGPGAGDGGGASSAGAVRTIRGDVGEGPRIGGVPVGPGDPRYGGGEGGIGDRFNVNLALVGGQGGAGGSARVSGEDALPLGGAVTTTGCGAPITTNNAPALATLPSVGYGFPVLELLAGSGGGGGGDKFDISPPGSLFDEQGGGGGGGGGAIGITAAGAVTVSGSILARGAAGGLGPTFAGAAGSGSGGMIWIRTPVQASFAPNAVLDVAGGGFPNNVFSCAAAPGRGGAGVIQVEDVDGVLGTTPLVMPTLSSFAAFPFQTVVSGTARSLFYDSGFDAPVYRDVTAASSITYPGSVVILEVQGARSDASTPTQPSSDPADRTAWLPASAVTDDPNVMDALDGYRFVRFRVTMSWLGATPTASLPFVDDVTIELDGNLSCP